MRSGVKFCKGVSVDFLRRSLWRILAQSIPLHFVGYFEAYVPKGSVFNCPRWGVFVAKGAGGEFC